MSFHAGRGERVVEPEQAVIFLQQLIRLNSVNPPGNEEKVAHFIFIFDLLLLPPGKKVWSDHTDGIR